RAGSRASPARSPSRAEDAMRTTRTITLELLRHGLSHNQLLSPLTQYLALCGNHGAETVTVPIDHRQFLARQRGLRYAGGEADRPDTLLDIGAVITQILDQVPGLKADL